MMMPSEASVVMMHATHTIASVPSKPSSISAVPESWNNIHSRLAAAVPVGIHSPVVAIGTDDSVVRAVVRSAIYD